MGRLHLFELEDFAWYPELLRNFETDLLRTWLDLFGAYDHTLPLIERCLEHATERRIVDLCSGAGGPWPRLSARLNERSPQPVEVTLTDLFPNRTAFTHLERQADGRLSHRAESLDATAVPENVHGARTIFSALHHFRPDKVKQILANARDAGDPIVAFEATHRGPVALFMFAFIPAVTLLLTPLVRPFRLSRLLFTYLIPIVPIVALWDGIVSCLRTYSPAELGALTDSLARPGWTWECGRVRGTWGLPVTYVIGQPEKAHA